MNHLVKHTPLAAAMLLALNSSFYSPAAGAIPPPPVIGPVVGDEFQVNTWTSGDQKNPGVAMDADGDFVIAWQSRGQDDSMDSSSFGIYAQRYHANGLVNGSEFPVNTNTTDSQISPVVAMDADGDFVIVWQSWYQDGSDWGIYAQLYKSDGTTVGNEFPVNTTSLPKPAAKTQHRPAIDSQSSPAVAMDANGDFVITWQGNQGGYYAVYARRYAAAGTALGGEFMVNTYTAGTKYKPDIAMDAAGDFVIAWASDGQDGDGYGIVAQRYRADGSANGGEFAVNTWTTSDQNLPSVAMDADGDFVIAWQSYGQDGDRNGIYAQRFSADGTPAAEGEFQVNSFTGNSQYSPEVAMDADGDFAITWTSVNQDYGVSNGVYARLYSADGIPAALGEFKVNTSTVGSTGPGIAVDAAGDFVVSYNTYGNADGSLSGVFAQRYRGMSKTVDLNLVVTDDTDPVKKGNNFVYSLITTNNGTGYAMDVNLSEPLPSGLTYVTDDSAAVGWSCAQDALTLNCNKPFMTAAEVNTINVTVTADATGDFSNTVSVSAAQADSNPADNTDTETTHVKGKGGGGGALGVFSLLLALPLCLRRRWLS